MKFDILDGGLNILHDWLYETDSAIDPVYGSKREIVHFLGFRLRDELDSNLSKCESEEEKADLLLEYIQQFSEIEKALNIYNWWFDEIAEFSKDRQSPNDPKDRPYLAMWEEYFISDAHHLNIIFDVIQRSCIKIGTTIPQLCVKSGLSEDTFTKRIITDVVYLQLTKLRQNKFIDDHRNDAICFSDIFSVTDWGKYISALKNTDPPLINDLNEFIGKPRLHKGVICSWIKHLQYKSIIRQSINRAQLSLVLNNEIKKLNLGKDGKTFDNESTEYTTVFEKQLLSLTA